VKELDYFGEFNLEDVKEGMGDGGDLSYYTFLPNPRKSLIIGVVFGFFLFHKTPHYLSSKSLTDSSLVFFIGNPLLTSPIMFLHP